MSYLLAVVVFVIALFATMEGFARFMPESYFQWMRRHSWGRELSGMLMTGIALGVALIVFQLFR